MTSLARLRRLRWRLTGLYTLTSAICLAVLATIAVGIDASSRAAAVDHEVDRAATALSRAVYYDTDGLHLQPLREDVLAASSTPVAVLEWSTVDDLAVRYPNGFTITRGMAAVADQARRTEETALGDGEGSQRLAAAPVWNGDRIAAVVVAAGQPQPGTLVGWLVLGCVVLVLLAGAAGHLLSGRSMRPAVQALDQQEQFLAEAAHELRTPLARLQLVADNGGPDAPARLSRLAGEMGRLVTGLLTRARLAAGTQLVEREPLRLDLLVEQVVDDHDGDVVCTGRPCVVNGDPELLTQAVRNLLANATRHSGGAAVEVTVDGGRVAVRDHGPGIAPEDRERMFQRAVAGAGGGSGIGLAIVRWVADLHGGSARLLGADGGGTIAELVLPTIDR